MTKALKPPALDPRDVAERVGTRYPEPFRAPAEGRCKRALGDALGLKNYGVNLVTLPPGCWSSQRHWHTHEDEFVYVLEGELTLVTEAGEQVLAAGMAAGFRAGSADGHHLINRSERPASYLEVGDRRSEDEVHYPDIDLAFRATAAGRAFTDKKGAPY